MFTNENQTFSTEKLSRFSFLGSLLLLSLAGLTFLFPTSNEPKKVSAANRTAASETNIVVNTNNEDLKLRLFLDDLNGSFAASEEDEKTKFNVTTNNFTGYTLTITSDTDDGDLINFEKDDHFSSIDSPTSITTFNDTSYNNKWGFFPSKYNSEINTEFLPAPTTEATVLDVTNAPNETANDYSIGVGARASFNKASGTYTTSFILNVTGNPVTYAILYADNTSDSAVANLPATQSSVIGESHVTLSNQIPTRTNYTFLNWCLGAATQNGTICNGQTYNPGDEFDLDQTSENAPTLYAIWSPNIAIRTNSGTTRVTLNGHVCNYGEPEASTVGCIVTGLKNGESYLLTGTLEEGYNFSAWDPGSGTITDTHSLTTNFAPSATPTTITPNTNAHTYPISLTNTDATTPGSTSATATRGSRELTPITNPKREYTVSGFSVGNNNSNGATVSSTHTIVDEYIFKGWYDSSNTKVIASSGYLEPSTPYTDVFGRWSVSNGAALHAEWDENPITLPTISKEGWTCGWSTAHTTNTIEYTSGYSSFVPTGNTVLHGVCVETGYTITFKTIDAENIEFDGTLYNDNQSVRVLPGTYSLRGHYAPRYAFTSWDATAGEISNADYVDYNLNTYTVTGNAVITLTGQYVETELQNLNPETCTTTPIPAYDNRDNQVYWIKQLDDGNCWMMDNLNLGAVDLTTDLTSTNTNLSSSISASTFNSWRKISGSSSYTSAEYIPLAKSNVFNDKDVDTTSGTKFGTLYNYCATSANTICTESNNNNATYDICPAGWRLPKSSNTDSPTNEFNNLYTNPSYDTGAKMRAPISEDGAAFTITGSFGSGTPLGQGYESGRYWASTRYDRTYMHILSVQGLSSGPSDIWSTNAGQLRNHGGSIRCILDTKPAITFNLINAESVELNGVTYHNGDKAYIDEGTYSLVANFGPKQAFQSWSATAGEITNSTYIDYYANKYTVVGNATITLTGKTVNTAIQNLPDSSCTSTPMPVYDNRDGQVYYIKRLADGNCWIMDNLNLGAKPLVTDLTDNNTNLDSTISISTFNSWKSDTGHELYSTPEFIVLTNENSSSGNTVDSKSGTKFGTIYNFCAASAGTHCPDHYDWDSSPIYDLCPAGWRLPTGGTSGDFRAIYDAVDTSDATIHAPVSENGFALALAGTVWFGGSPGDQNSYGAYWTASRHWNAEMMFNAIFSGQSFHSDNATNNGRDDPSSIRCIHK